MRMFTGSSLQPETIDLRSCAIGTKGLHRDLNRLPKPVARYFRHVLEEEQALIREVHLTQEGKFRVSRTGNWYPFQATQCFMTRPAGFVWNAVVHMAPMLNVYVRDAYLEGHASMEAKILKVIPWVKKADELELTAAAMQRYLAEAIWFPTALLPSDHVTWTALTDSKALATLSDCCMEVSLEFEFNDEGEVTTIYAPNRYAFINNEWKLTPWLCHCSGYQKRYGILIPTQVSVEWIYKDGAFSYFDGKVLDIDYEYHIGY
ncbi:MAG TPA: DUF6544 family protein [Acidobacteriota bacterium]|nr:DUF6544 family protein [Acidobacteriota bacterium]